MATRPAQPGDRWTVGELAAATGLSVRVLRHWDEIGVARALRTTGGHRYYTATEVSRLYRALALRQMGLRLDEVRALLADADPSPRATLAAHLERVTAELAAGQALRARLVEALDAIDAAAGCHDHGDQRAEHDGDIHAPIDAEQLMKVIEKMTMFDQHLSTGERDWFARRREQVGEQAWQQAMDAWPELIEAVRTEMDAGTEPTDPRLGQLMARWHQLARVFLDDDPQMRTAAGRAWQAMWDQHSEQLRRSPRVAPPEMWDYVQRARDAHSST